MRGEASRPGKRPARNLSAAEKLEIIQRVHDGESKASVARNIGVPESTLRGWCKTELKLRSMTRNSSTTPDSEAHSSSGSNHVPGGPSHLSSDEEIDAGPSSSKRKKLDLEVEQDTIKQQTTAAGYDYATQFLSAMMATGVRGGDSMMLMQQMGLLPGMTGNISQLMSLPALQALTAASSNSSTSQTVGLVENGLQYSKSSAGNNSKHQRHSSSSAHATPVAAASILAPSRHDSVPKRNSLPPAAEAPLTVSPVSPRKTTEHSLSNGALHKHQQLSRSSSRKDNGTSGSQQDVLRWLENQQQIENTTAAAADLSQGNKSFFYNWYKKDVMSSTSRLSSSPSKAKALLDNMLGNVENVHTNLPQVTQAAATSSGDNECEALELKKSMSSEEAVQHGQKFYEWLSTCSDPNVTRVHIMQLEQILQNVKSSHQSKSSRSKHSRK